MYKFFVLSLLSFGFFITSLYGADITDSSTNISFPAEVTVTDNGKQITLDATGVATRKKFFVKVYSVAHYLEKGANANQILDDSKAKQLTLKFVHEASADKLRNSYQESYHANGGDPSLNNELNKFLSFFSDTAKGDEHTIIWLPGGHVEVFINGTKTGELTNPAFAKGLWNIWFGNKSVVDKDKLTSGA